MTVSDNVIRAAIRLRASRFPPDQGCIHLVEELELEQGAARIDMAFIGHDLLGVEIKSPKDSLARLQTQSQIYSRVFDRVVLVTDQKFVGDSRQMIPEWWGIVTFYVRGSSLSFRSVRAPMPNPAVESDAIVELLWKNELLSILYEKTGQQPKSTYARKILRDQVVENTDNDELKTFSLSAFKNRQNWRNTVIESPS